MHRADKHGNVPDNPYYTQGFNILCIIRCDRADHLEEEILPWVSHNRRGSNIRVCFFKGNVV